MIDPETGEPLAAADPRSNEPPASIGQGMRPGVRQKLPETGETSHGCLAKPWVPRLLRPCE